MNITRVIILLASLGVALPVIQAGETERPATREGRERENPRINAPAMEPFPLMERIERRIAELQKKIDNGTLTDAEERDLARFNRIKKLGQLQRKRAEGKDLTDEEARQLRTWNAELRELRLLPPQPQPVRERAERPAPIQEVRRERAVDKPEQKSPDNIREDVLIKRDKPAANPVMIPLRREIGDRPVLEPRKETPSRRQAEPRDQDVRQKLPPLPVPEIQRERIGDEPEQKAPKKIKEDVIIKKDLAYAKSAKVPQKKEMVKKPVIGSSRELLAKRWAEAREKGQDIRQKMAEIRRRMFQAASDPKLNEELVKDLAAQIGKLEAELAFLRGKMMREIQEKLPPQQFNQSKKAWKQRDALSQKRAQVERKRAWQQPELGRVPFGPRQNFFDRPGFVPDPRNGSFAPDFYPNLRRQPFPPMGPSRRPFPNRPYQPY